MTSLASDGDEEVDEELNDTDGLAKYRPAKKTEKMKQVNNNISTIRKMTSADEHNPLPPKLANLPKRPTLAKVVPVNSNDWKSVSLLCMTQVCLS